MAATVQTALDSDLRPSAHPGYLASGHDAVQGSSGRFKKITITVPALIPTRVPFFDPHLVLLFFTRPPKGCRWADPFLWPFSARFPKATAVWQWFRFLLVVVGGVVMSGGGWWWVVMSDGGWW